MTTTSTTTSTTALDRKDITVYVGDSSGVTRKTLKREFGGAPVRLKTFSDPEGLTAALLREPCDLILLGDFKEMQTLDIIDAWNAYEGIRQDRVVVMSDRPDLMVDTSDTAVKVLKLGIIGLLSKPVRLRHVKELIEEKAENETIRELAKSLVTLTKTQQRRRKSNARRRFRQRRKSLSGIVKKQIVDTSAPRRKSFPKNIYSNAQISEKKVEEKRGESLPVMVKDEYEIPLFSPRTEAESVVETLPKVKNSAVETLPEVKDDASNVKRQETQLTKTTEDQLPTLETKEQDEKTIDEDSKDEERVSALPKIQLQQEQKSTKIETPLLYSNRTLGEILKFSNGDRWFGPVMILENGKRKPHGRGTLRFSPENTKLVREKFWTEECLERENYVWFGDRNELRTAPRAGSYGTMIYLHSDSSWCGKVQRRHCGDDKKTFNPQRVNLVGVKGTLRFLRNNTSWRGPIDLVRGRPFNGSLEDDSSRIETYKMSYSNGDVWTGFVDPMTYYPVSKGTMVYAKHRGAGMFFVGNVVPFENTENIHILDPSSVTYNTSVRVIGEGKMFVRKGTETECVRTGQVYVLNGFEVRIAEESPKKLRIEKASEHVKQHCLASMSPKRRHSTKKSYFRDRADSREVLQGSSFFNDLVKRSSIQKERISTEGLATHHEKTSSPKRYRDRKILKRDDVFSGNR